MADFPTNAPRYDRHAPPGAPGGPATGAGAPDTPDGEQGPEDRLQTFGLTLAKLRDEWVRARRASGVDKRWLEDMDQYNSKDNVNRATAQMMESVEQGYPVTSQGARPTRSTVYIGMTRQKTNAAESRVADILLPVDDRNWGIQPSPVPELSSMTKNEEAALNPQTKQPVVDPQTGQPVRIKDVARAVMALARKKSEAMQREIEDKLNEADYNGEQRKIIHDAAVLGTGVIKGPVVTNRTRRAWTTYTDVTGDSVQQLDFVEEIAPASFRIDVRNCYPDPACGENIQHGRGVFEMEKLTPKRVRDLAKQPGYSKEQIRRVLEEGPKLTATMTELRDEAQRDLTTEYYEKWEYWGEIDHEDLEALGLQGDADGKVDVLKSYSACIVMINSTVIKAFISPIEDGSLPYDFYPWERVAGSVFGYGVPYLMRSQQKVLNAAWRQMMDNSGVTSGPQIVIKTSIIRPADGKWEITGRKLWYATDDTDDVRKAFTAVEFNSKQVELAAIIKMATELADAETGVPTIMQGEKGAAPDTVGGMQMLMNSANVVLRRLVKQYDDMITRPHIRRYYDYEMLHNEEEDIKGDFTVDARGSSALLVRDIQNQAFLNLLVAGGNPIYGKYLNPQKLLEKALQAQHIDPAEVFKSDEEIEQINEAEKQAQGQQQPDPRILAAQINAQAAEKRVALQNQGDMAELQTRERIAVAQHESEERQRMMDRDIAMMKLASAQNLSLQSIKSQLAQTAIRERSKKELFVAESRLKQQMGTGI